MKLDTKLAEIELSMQALDPCLDGDGCCACVSKLELGRTLEDWNLQDDLAVLESRLKSLPNSEELLDGIVFPDPVADALHADHLANGCCCVSHCALLHSSTAPLRSYQALQSIAHTACDLCPVLPTYATRMNELEPELELEEELPLDNLSDYLMNFCPA